MTTPGGVLSLPHEALTIDTLASKLQDMSGTAMKNRAAARFPGMFNNSTGLNPALEFTPFGLLTRIWAEANSVIANADPADIQTPEDIPDLLLQFIDGLPLVGQFIDILEAITGTYGGEDETLLAVQEIFAPIRKLMQLVAGIGEGFPTLEALSEGWGTNVTEVRVVVNQIIDILNGLVVTPINGAVQGVVDWFSGLGSRLDHDDDRHGSLLDGLWGGLSRSGGSGKSIADVGNAAASTADLTDTAVQVGEWNNAVLSLRNNKSLSAGVDETSESNYSYEDIWGIGTEPAAAYSATETAVPVAYWRATEVAKKGFIAWFGKGIVSELRIDVYRADYVGGKWEHIHTSSNVAGLADGTWRILTYNIASLIDRIDVYEGVVLGVAWRVVGAGTHSIAGKPIAGLPEHPTIHPKKLVSVRTGVGDLALSSTSYTANTQPWFGIGILTGDAPPPYYAPRRKDFTASVIYTIPPEFRVAGNLIDLVAIGSGAGGDGSLAYVPGPSGLPGQWAHVTLVYGVDIPLGTETLNISIGPRGVGGTGSVAGSGSAGAATTVSLPDGTVLLSAPGGSGNTYDEGGSAAVNHSYNGVTYQGGTRSGVGNVGNTPGGGGGGGLPYLSGKDGGNGGTSITVRQP